MVELSLVLAAGFGWAGGGFFPTMTLGCVPRLPVSGLAREDATVTVLADALAIVDSNLEHDVTDHVVADPDSIGVDLLLDKSFIILKEPHLFQVYIFSRRIQGCEGVSAEPPTYYRTISKIHPDPFRPSISDSIVPSARRPIDVS